MFITYPMWYTISNEVLKADNDINTTAFAVEELVRMTTTTQVALTAMQQSGVDMIEEWHKYQPKMTFFLAGYAGTGKTTLVHYAIAALGLKKFQVAYACYTGKAALVLTQKSHGDFTATTIHKLIYKVSSSESGVPQFKKKAKHELSYLELIVIDEASMVDAKTLKDLKSFGKKILFIGDQGQLPPLEKSDTKDFLEIFNNPDYALTEIHRQAKGNPIIHISMLARTGQPIPYGKYGDNNEVVVLTRSQWFRMKTKVFDTADQIICGYNRTRKQLNAEIRAFKGFTSELPQVGDKLICTRNKWNLMVDDVNLVNGMTGFVEKVSYGFSKGKKKPRKNMKLKFKADFMKDSFTNLHVAEGCFTESDYKLEVRELRSFADFDYGYVVTCHKSQGSQWDNVVVINEVLDRKTHDKWLYTAITRSSGRLILVI